MQTTKLPLSVTVLLPQSHFLNKFELGVPE